MAKSKVQHTLIPSEEQEMSEQQSEQTASDAAVSEEERPFDAVFWGEVQEKAKELSWNRAMDEVRADRLVRDHGKRALLVIINNWPQKEPYKKKPELIPSLENLISRLTEIILKRCGEEYEDYRVPEEENANRPTLLHLAAKHNLLHVSRCLVDRYPDLLYLPTVENGKYKDYPVELALREYNDETAAYLLSKMRYDSIRELFLCDEVEREEGDDRPLVKFYFGKIISHRNSKNKCDMKKTVLAVLDKLINPRWPYLPDQDGRTEENKDDIERAIESVPDDPMNYDFNYHVLEADENGRQPKIDAIWESGETGEITNPNFNQKSVSCLRLIADSENKEAVQHPVVRMLVSRKWNQFAHKWFCIKAVVYVIFLLVLSFALIYGSTHDDPTDYGNSADNLRAFCEICSIIFLMYHLFEEIDEIAKERSDYFRVWHNYFDLFGVAFTLLVIPLRFAESKYQWTFASLGYILNFLRLFKFANVTRTTGLYTHTLVKIIQKDITRFMLVFIVIFVGFCGAFFMALKVDNEQDSFSHFGWLMLAGFRALVEQSPVVEEYSPIGWLAILILLSYMGMVIVILLNVLIAQLSYTYSEAKKIAKLQYAADAMRIVTRMEYSRFAFWNYRVKNYIDGDWVSDEDLAKEILEYSEDRHPWETVQERITDVREFMRKFVRKDKGKDPWETVDDKVTRLTEIVRKDKEKDSLESIDIKLNRLKEIVQKHKEKDSLESIDDKLTRLTAMVEEIPKST